MLKRAAIALIVAATVSWAPTGCAARVYDEAGRALVLVHVRGTLKDPPGQLLEKKDFDDYGTGFLVSPDGLIFTAGHLIPDDPQVFEDGQFDVLVSRVRQNGNDLIADDEHETRVTVIEHKQKPYDVALLKMPTQAEAFPFLPMCDDQKPEDPIKILNFTGGDPRLLSKDGSIAFATNPPSPMELSPPLDPGTSGAPIFNSVGRVIAINLGLAQINDSSVQYDLGVAIPEAIAATKPEGPSLEGLSHVPRCATPLGPPPELRRLTAVAKSVRLVPGQSFIQEFAAPDGYEIIDAYRIQSFATRGSLTPSSPVDIRPTDDGRKLEVPVVILGYKAPTNPKKGAMPPVDIDSSIDVHIVPRGRNPIHVTTDPTAEIVSITFNRNQDEHNFLSTTFQHQEDISVAKAGYRFGRIRAVWQISHTYSPSNGICVRPNSDAKRLTVFYALESSAQLSFSEYSGSVSAMIDVALIPDDGNFDGGTGDQDIVGTSECRAMFASEIR
jgi:hypothetical protein